VSAPRVKPRQSLETGLGEGRRIARAARMHRFQFLLATLAPLAACDSGDDRAGRVPLGVRETAAATTADSIGADARATLAQGNVAFRARRYEEALGLYRRAAAAAPRSAAPLWGIQMAARALGDSALADSAVTEIRARSPELRDVPRRDPHGDDALPPNHPPLRGPGSG
jgi:hypothetical protein